MNEMKRTVIGSVVIEEAAEYSPTRRDEIITRLSEIDRLTTKPRTTRELALGNAATKAWVTALDSEAATLRTELAGL